MADMWEVFGVNALDIWDLLCSDFFSMTVVIDRMRQESKKAK